MSAYSDRVIADGASHYWRLNETSGTTAVATVGGANGTISGGVTLNQPSALTDGTKAMVFDGTTGKIITSANVTIPLVSTIEVWMKTTSSATGWMFSNRQPSEIPGSFVVGQDVGKVVVFAGMGLSGVSTIIDGQWHHIVVVQNVDTASIYRDGVFEATGLTGRTDALASPVGIGYDGEWTQFFNGSIDEVAIYSRALTAPEILQHYQLGTAVTSVIAGAKVTSIPVGVSTTLDQGTVYALPSRLCIISTSAACEVGQAFGGPWSALGTTPTGARFIRCSTGAVTVTCKVRRR